MKVIELISEESNDQKRNRQDKDRLRRDYLRWKRLVNVPIAVIEAARKTARGKTTGLSARDKKLAKSYRMTNSTVNAIYRMRNTSFDQWKTSDINWMYRMLQYIDKYKKHAKDLPLMVDGKPTTTLKNLWAWGHAPKGLRPSVRSLHEDVGSKTGITPGNVDGAYKIGAVNFDNENGIGATPDNANIMYKGFVTFMKPSEFRKLAAPGNRSADAKEITKLIQSGESIGNPCLYLDISEPDIGTDAPFQVKVSSHEGRARSLAFETLNGDHEMPVQMFPRYFRARNLSTEWFENLRENGITPEQGGSKVVLKLSPIFWQGKEV